MRTWTFLHCNLLFIKTIFQEYFFRTADCIRNGWGSAGLAPQPRLRLRDHVTCEEHSSFPLPKRWFYADVRLADGPLSVQSACQTALLYFYFRSQLVSSVLPPGRCRISLPQVTAKVRAQFKLPAFRVSFSKCYFKYKKWRLMAININSISIF